MKRLIKLTLFVSIILIAANLYLPKILFHHILDRNPEIITKFKNQIEEQSANIVLMGNSILKKGIDPILLEELIGTSLLDISVNGSTTPVWYLLLKNNVAASRQRPLTVVIFFKNERLTTVGPLDSQLLTEQIHKFGGENESQFDEIAYDLSGLDLLALNVFSPYAYQSQLKELIEGPFKYALASLQGELEREGIDAIVEQSFSNANMNLELLNQSLETSKIYGDISSEISFSSRLESSFLPLMIDLAKSKEIELIFVRMKTKENLKRADSHAQMAYFDQLKDYLDEKGLLFFDFSDVEELGEEHFDDRDHLNEIGEQVFTELFAKTLLKNISKVIP